MLEAAKRHGVALLGTADTTSSLVAALALYERGAGAAGDPPRRFGWRFTAGNFAGGRQRRGQKRKPPSS